MNDHASTTRRAFLKSAPIAAASIAIPAAALAVEPEETPVEKRDRLLNELQSVLSGITGTEWVFNNSEKIGCYMLLDTYEPVSKNVS